MTFEEHLAQAEAGNRRLEAARAYSRRKRRGRRDASRKRAAACRSAAVGLALLLPIAACAGAAPADGGRAKWVRPATVQTVPAITSVHYDPAPAEEPENERIEAALLERARVIEDCAVTFYDCCAACCGKADGITATGLRAAPYVTCAVDPDVIPLGSDVLLDYGDGELHCLRAEDTGVSGNAVDVCVEGHQEALELGLRTAKAYWVPPGE